LQSFKFFEVEQLMAEQINYLTQAFQIIANSEGNYGLGIGMIKDFMPKLLKHT